MYLKIKYQQFIYFQQLQFIFNKMLIIYCIIATIISIIILIIYGYIRRNYAHIEFEDIKYAHKYSFYEIFPEWILVLIIQ